MGWATIWAIFSKKKNGHPVCASTLATEINEGEEKGFSFFKTL
jgi:hypothetical protein